MATPSQLTKHEKAFHIEDESNRPLTIVRLRFHPTQRRLVAQIVDRRLAL